MRKTLAVLALMIGSLLFLASPAWAHHLYSIQKGTSQSADANGLRKTAYTAIVDCATAATFSSTAWSPSTVKGHLVGKVATGKYKYTFSANLRPSRAATTVNTHVTCLTASGKVLPFSGRSVAPQLLLGVGLLLVGGLLIAVTVRPRKAVFRRS